LAWLAVAVGAVEFLFRALLRSNSLWMSDLTAPYVSARLWLSGGNPYDSHIFLSTWAASGAPESGLKQFLSEMHSVYPPPTLLVMAPMALIRWPGAVHLFIALALLLYGIAVLGLIRLGWPQHRRVAEFVQDPLAMLFLAFCLGFAPIHTAFNSENIVLLAACAAIIAVVLLTRSGGEKTRRSSRVAVVLAGVAITASICLKPTTGVFLLPWLVRERRWRLLGSVIAVCGALAAVSLQPLLAHHGMTWLASYKNNVNLLFAHGGNADVSPENLENTDRIDLQLVLYALTGNRTVTSLIAALAYVAILIAFFRGAGWRRTEAVDGRDLPLLVAAGALALGLLPVYSRIYSALALLPLVLWCFGHLRLSSARWLLVLLCDFLVNSSAIVRRLGQMSEFATREPRLWDFSVGGHTCWLMLAIGLLLVKAMHQQRHEMLDSSMAGTSLS
jgi:hypothetical protein